LFFRVPGYENVVGAADVQKIRTESKGCCPVVALQRICGARFSFHSTVRMVQPGAGQPGAEGSAEDAGSTALERYSQYGQHALTS